MTFADAQSIAMDYFGARLRNFSVMLPSDSGERVMSIMQFVEKRIVRYAHRAMLEITVLVCFGQGSDGWGRRIGYARIEGLRASVMPWPSEQEILGAPTPTLPIDSTKCEHLVCIGTFPHGKDDTQYLSEIMTRINASLIVFDCHPNLCKHVCKQEWMYKHRRLWRWQLDASAYGEPQARFRTVIVSTRLVGPNADNMGPLYVLDVQLPSVISEYMHNSDLWIKGQICLCPRDKAPINQSHWDRSVCQRIVWSTAPKPPQEWSYVSYREKLYYGAEGFV